MPAMPRPKNFGKGKPPEEKTVRLERELRQVSAHIRRLEAERDYIVSQLRGNEV